MTAHTKKLVLFLASLVLAAAGLFILDKWASVGTTFAYLFIMGFLGFGLGMWNLLTALEKEMQKPNLKP